MNYKIIGKYIKDLKFNIPNPKIFFLIAENISNYKINIDIKSKQFKEKIVEIETSLTLNPTKNDFEKIEVEIKHSTIIELDGDFSNKQKLEQIILIEVPEKVYSEIRETFVFLFEKSGFKDIKIDKNVDFKKLYNQRKN